MPRRLFFFKSVCQLAPLNTEGHKTFFCFTVKRIATVCVLHKELSLKLCNIRVKRMRKREDREWEGVDDYRKAYKGVLVSP